MPNLSKRKADLKLIPTEGINREEIKNYAWFPVKGHSMTNEKKEYSIPEGSIVLGKKISINHAISFPIHTPVLLMGNYKGEPFALVKEIAFVDAAFRFSVLCKSYNESYNPFWIPMDCIFDLFKVEQIKRPGSLETIIVKS